MLKYGYFKVNTLSGTGYVCVALCRPEVNETRHTASFSFCSPKEKSFSKKRGRTIANGRLEIGKLVEFNYTGDITGAFIKALTTALNDYLLPSWVVKKMNKGIVFGMKGRKNNKGENVQTLVVWKQNCVIIVGNEIKPEKTLAI